MWWLWLACTSTTEDTALPGVDTQDTGSADPDACEELRWLNNDVMVMNSAHAEDIFCEKYNAVRGDVLATVRMGCVCEVTGTIYANESASFPNLVKAGEVRVGVDGPDLSGFPALREVGNLGIRDSGVQSLHGMDALQTAEFITILDNDDLTTLAGLPWDRLDTAWIQVTQNAQLTSMAGLEGARQLYSLQIGQDAMTTLEGLHNLESISVLGIHDTPLASLDGLRGLTSIGTLRLYDSPMTSLAGLEGLQTLGSLDLRDNALTTLQPLQGWTTMGTLRLEEHHLADIAPLSGLTTLENLVLHGSSPPDLHGLDALQRIDGNLNLGGDWTTIDGLESLAIARNLNLYDSALTTLDGLDLKNMKSIDLRRNADLVDITALETVGVVYDHITIVDNPQLTDDAAWALVEAIGLGNIHGEISISGNGP